MHHTHSPGGLLLVGAVVVGHSDGRDLHPPGSTIPIAARSAYIAAVWTRCASANMVWVLRWVEFNSPVVLTFAILCCAATFLDRLCAWPIARALLDFFQVPVHDQHCFSVPLFSAWPWKHFNVGSPMSWLRLITHIFGHNTVAHLSGNMQLFLVVGPVCVQHVK